MLKYLHASNGDKTPISIPLLHVSPATQEKQAISISQTPLVYVWSSGIQWLFMRQLNFLPDHRGTKGHPLTKYLVRPEVRTNFKSQDDYL